MGESPQPTRAAAGATVHGVYDYWLGGGSHLREDRELAAAIAVEYASVPSHVRAAQEFHLRAARWASRRGISRFVHAGHVTALPPGRNVHDAAREAGPAAEVVYAYRDAEAHAMSKGLLPPGPGVTAVLSGPGGFLAAEPVRAMLAGGEPACVIAGLLLHFAPGDVAAAKIARAAAALPRGSVLAASVALAAPTPRGDGLLAMFTPARAYRHTAADVGAWLAAAGLEIVPPGVTDVRVVPGTSPAWAAGEMPAAAPGFIAGVVARKP